jgi:general secretion pathway protein G
MMTVLALLLIFASFALPTYQNIVIRTREAALRDDLYTMRSMIDRFTLDNQRAPASLQELVDAGYLGAIPSDPFTRSTDTWQVELKAAEFLGSETLR